MNKKAVFEDENGFFLAFPPGIEPGVYRLGVRRSLQNSVKNDDFLAILAVLSTILHPNWLISTVN